MIERQFPTCLSQIMITHHRKSGISGRTDSFNCSFSSAVLVFVISQGLGLKRNLMCLFLRVIEAAIPCQYVTNKANVNSQEDHYHNFQLA